MAVLEPYVGIQLQAPMRLRKIQLAVFLYLLSQANRLILDGKKVIVHQTPLYPQKPAEPVRCETMARRASSVMHSTHESP